MENGICFVCFFRFEIWFKFGVTEEQNIRISNPASASSRYSIHSIKQKRRDIPGHHKIPSQIADNKLVFLSTLIPNPNQTIAIPNQASHESSFHYEAGFPPACMPFPYPIIALLDRLNDRSIAMATRLNTIAVDAWGTGCSEATFAGLIAAVEVDVF